MGTDNQLQPVHTDDATAGAEVLGARLQELLLQIAAPQSIHHAVVAVEKGDGSFRIAGTRVIWFKQLKRYV